MIQTEKTYTIQKGEQPTEFSRVFQECANKNRCIQDLLDENIEKLEDAIYQQVLFGFEESLREVPLRSKVFVQIPISHGERFYSALHDRKNTPSSRLFNMETEVCFIDYDNDIMQFDDGNAEQVQEKYQNISRKIRECDKFLQIVDGGKTLKQAKNPLAKKIEEEYTRACRVHQTRYPRFRTYLPTNKQAEREDMTYAQFARFIYEVSNMDWKKSKECNQELIETLDKLESIEIQGESISLTCRMQNQAFRNSCIEANFPGSEVFSAPNKYHVDGYIHFPHAIYCKLINEDIRGFFVRFEEGKCVDIDIKSNEYSQEEKEEKLRKIRKVLNEKEGNKYLGEIAFGTNFLMPTGIRHTLLGEKAAGMHWALGTSYNYPGTSNGNTTKESNIHWDMIRDMSDASVIGHLPNDKEMLIMQDGEYNPEYFPKTYSLQKSLEPQAQAIRKLIGRES